MIEASCHCGAVRLRIATAPAEATDCNCSICRRLGALWAYVSPTQVIIDGLEATQRYVRCDTGEPPMLAFHRCATCGCTTHWRSLDPGVDRMGLNARLMSPEDLSPVRIRRFDGAATWTALDDD